MVRQVRSSLKKNNVLDAKEEEQKFFEYLTKEIQARRNRTLITSVKNVTGIPTTRNYANSIATIVYDIHILGDYETNNTSALPSISDIEYDLLERGFKRLLADNGQSSRLQQIRQEFDAAVRVGRGRINKERAKNLIEAVQKFLPQILNELFKNTLNRKGITIVES